MIGSDFEIRVWETLLELPLGKATTYSDIAAHIGQPTAARAVGAAVGKNPISFVVPCHRVLGKGGSLCGYHWGLTRKRAILGWEAGRGSRAGDCNTQSGRDVSRGRGCLRDRNPVGRTAARFGASAATTFSTRNRSRDR